jgi:hypothetical protein
VEPTQGTSRLATLSTVDVSGRLFIPITHLSFGGSVIDERQQITQGGSKQDRKNETKRKNKNVEIKIREE